MLSLQEMRKVRSSAELSAWVKSIDQNVRESQQLQQEFRLNEGLAKQFNEEIRPLAIMGTCLAERGLQTTIEPMVSDQLRYDAILRLGRGSKEQKVEITFAKDGYQEKLRALHTNQFKHAPAGQNINHVRNAGKTVVVETRPISTPRDFNLHGSFILIREALSRKLSKSYPADVWFIAAFSDEMALSQRNADADFHELFDAHIATLPRNGRMLFVIGLSGQLLAHTDPLPASD